MARFMRTFDDYADTSLDVDAMTSPTTSTDYGASWTRIAGDLPPNCVVRIVREDPRNPNVVWLGTEFGGFTARAARA